MPYQLIIFPINQNETSDNVANLQQALIKLLPLQGFASVVIAQSEILSKTAGATTINAVKLIKDKNGIATQAASVLVDGPTASLLNKLLTENGLLISTGAIDPATNYTVSGKVVNQFGEGIGNKPVMAYDVDLKGARIYKTAKTIADVSTNGGMQLLGNTVSGTDGSYSIAFTYAQFSNLEIGLADVVCYATSTAADGTITIAGLSAMTKDSDYINGLSVINLDIQLTATTERGISEYGRLTAVILPFVQGNQLQLFQLSGSDDQVNFLASETRQDQNHTSLLVQADQLRQDMIASVISITVSPDTSLTELFYGIGRQNITLAWASLLNITDEAFTTAVQQSITQNIIEPFTTDQVNEFVTRLMNFAVKYSVTAPETAALYKMLGFSVQDPVLQQSLVGSLSRFNGKPEDFWADLSKQETVTPAIIQSLQLTNQLNLLTGGQTALVEELQVKRSIKALPDLLSLTTDDWNAVIAIAGVPDAIPGTTLQEKTTTYISGMQNLLQAAFPTKKIAMMLGNNQLFVKDAAVKEKVSAFFAATQNFDISVSRISDFDDAIKTVSGDLHDQVVLQIQQFQRIYQVSPSPESMNTLLTRGYTSAYQITSYAQNAFIQLETDSLGGADIAYSVYNRASHQVMRARHTILKVRDLMDKATPSKIISAAQQTSINNYFNTKTL